MKKRYNLIKVFIGLVFLITLMSAVNPVLPPIPFDYENLNLPAHFADALWADNTPATDSVTDDGATLGRVLFYDKNLSTNNSVSCGSCHKQEFAFADTSRKSLGFNNDSTRRNTLSLVNTRYFFGGEMFWDTRGDSLESAVLMPIHDTLEMGMPIGQLEQVVRQQSYYPQLFLNAFGDTAVSSLRIGMALSQFMRSIVSHSSKYDVGRAMVNSPTVPFPNFTSLENIGKQIFFNDFASGGGDCFICHRTEAFIGLPGGINNGLDSVSTTDLGVYEATGVNHDIGAFKAPTLRNIELTGPYMHDGRFRTLNEVIDFYSTGIQMHMNLPAGLIVTDSLTGIDSPRQFNFTMTQHQGLVDFLQTLTDVSILSEVKWSDPFILSTSIESEDDLYFTLYPNPCVNYISVNASGLFQDRIVDLEIIDVNGRLIYSEKVFSGRRKMISVSEFPAGIYFVRMKIDGKEVSKKLLKGN